MVQLIPIKRVVLDAIAGHFNVPIAKLAGDKTFKDFGGDSLDFTSLVINLEHDLDIDIDTSVMNQHTTLDRFISKIEEAREVA